MAAPRRWSFVKALLFFLNVWSTALTLLTLTENQIVNLVTGKYDAFRQRLLTGGINTNIIEPEFFDPKNLVPLEDIATYTMIKTPRRDLHSIGEFHSVCTNINTNSAPVIANYFDDFWGHGPRRVLLYVFSISAPKCDVFTVSTAWRDACVAKNQNNATLCHSYILNNFDTLRKNRKNRLLAKNEFGVRGVPFLRCLGRPLQSFPFKADVLAHQTYWDGGSYHVSIQTSPCTGKPLVRSDDWEYALFESVHVDDGAEMLVALPPVGWVVTVISALYSVVTIVMIAQGVIAALFHKRTVAYLPQGVRASKGHDKWYSFLTPSMASVIYVSGHERSVVTFTGRWLMVSDVWMSHWLYMTLSILDALLNVRLTYVTLQFATAMLIYKITVDSVLFMFTAVIKVAWLMCLVQTFVRAFLKFIVRCIRAVRLIRPATREKLMWNIDSVSMFLSYRLYNWLLCLLLTILLVVRGSPSFMTRAVPFKVAANGGTPEIAGFWGSEVTCDLFTLLGLLTVMGQILGLVLMMTKYRHIANNRVMRLLQERFVISGWDGLMAADVLGLDPGDPELLVNGCALTKCSVGSLLQLAYMSGPSGFVHLAGDYIFHDSGFSKDPMKFRFSIHEATAMGLFETRGSASATSQYVAPSSRTATMTLAAGKPSNRASTKEDDSKNSIFTRTLRIVSEGYLGKTLLLDASKTGQLVTDKDTGAREYEVIDALTTMSILDVKWLLGNEKKLRLE